MPEYPTPRRTPPPPNNLRPDGTAAEFNPLTPDPWATPCLCGKSMSMARLPFVHCPSCHETYRAKRLSHPVRCAKCDFNLFQWRRRNAIEPAEIPFK